MANFELTLDLNKQPELAQTVNMKRGDFGSMILDVTIVHNGEQVNLSGKTARFECLRKDGSKVISEEFSLSSNAFEYSIPEQVGTIEGVIKTAYFAFLDGEVWRDTSEVFYINVQESAITGISKGDYIADIDKALGLMNAYLALAGDSEAQRTSNEEARIAAELARATAEIVRTQAEDARIQAETLRSQAETARTNAETARSSAEDARANAEAQRLTDEAERLEAEAERKLAESKRQVDFADMIEAAQGLTARVLEEGEYDPATRRPAITGVPGIIYLVPIDDDPATDDGYSEWMWIDEKWEFFGTTAIVIQHITTNEIDSVINDESPQGTSLLSLTGLSYMWLKIKDKVNGLISSTVANYLPLAGGKMTGFIDGNMTEVGLRAVDLRGYNSGLIEHSHTGALWIGRPLTEEEGGKPGGYYGNGTYINAGVSNSSGNPFGSIKIAVPNSDNSAFASYDALHKGNIKERVEGFTITDGTNTLPMTAYRTPYGNSYIYLLDIKLHDTVLQNSFKATIGQGNILRSNAIRIQSPVLLSGLPMLIGAARNGYSGYIGGAAFSGNTIEFYYVDAVSANIPFALNFMFISG